MNEARIPIVVLVSGDGSNLQALIDGQQSGALPVRIQAVISNRPESYALERAKKAGIAAVCIKHTDYETREDFDKVLLEEVLSHRPQLVVLAGFMRILTPLFVSPLNGHLINLHPSLLPKYPGLNPHKQALEAKDKMHGASVHFVNTELDAGPVIMQGQIDISKEQDETVVRKRVQVEVEHHIVPLCVRWYTEGRIRLEGEAVYLDGAELPSRGHQYSGRED